MAQIDRADLKKHAYWLADDARQGRFTSSKAQFEVANYIAQQFQKLGLKPLGDKKGYLQLYPLDKTYLDTTATSLSFGNNKITANYAVLPSSDGDKLLLSGHFAFCGNGSPEQLAKGGLKGRIPVVAVGKAPRGAAGSPIADWSAMKRCTDIAKKLAGEGATAAVICVLDDQSAFANALNYQALLPEHPLLKFHGEGRKPGESAIPLLFLAKAQSLKLLPAMGIQLDDDGTPTGGNDKLTGKLQITVKNDPKANACNVVAWLEGKGRKNEAVVFSAHMDHVGVRLDGDVFNGADDDASGTSGLLEVAEAFAKGDKPARSIVFLSVSGEELGLWGSSFFADNPTWPKDQIVADVNLDMIGRAESDGERTKIQVTPSYTHPKFSTIVRDAARLAATMHVSLTSGDKYYERSDHYNFAKKGIPVVFFCDGEHPDYHQVSDSADKLDYPKMETIARLAFWTGWLVANAKERPQDLGSQSGW